MTKKPSLASHERYYALPNMDNIVVAVYIITLRRIFSKQALMTAVYTASRDCHVTYSSTHHYI